MGPDSEDTLACPSLKLPARSDDEPTMSDLLETEGPTDSASELHSERSLYSSSRVSSPQANILHPPGAPPPSPIRQRTAQACDKCRERKTKCSGHRPACLRCTNRGLICEYSQRETRLRGARFPSGVCHPGTNMNYSHFIPQKSRPVLPYQSMARGGPCVGGLASSLGSYSLSPRSHIAQPDHDVYRKSLMDDQPWRGSSYSYVDNGCSAVSGGCSGNSDFSSYAPIFPQRNYPPVQGESDHSFQSQVYGTGSGSIPLARFPNFNLNFDYDPMGLHDPTPSSHSSQDTSGSSSSSRCVTPSSSTYEAPSEMSDLVMIPYLQGSQRAQLPPGTCWGEYSSSSMPASFSAGSAAAYQLDCEIQRVNQLQLAHPAPIPTEALTEAGSLVDGDPLTGSATMEW